MKHIISHNIHFCLVCLLALAALASCVKDEGEHAGITETGTKVNIEIFTRAYSYDVPIGRATANEGAVEVTPWVVVFKDSGTGMPGDAQFVESTRAKEWPDRQRRYVELTLQTEKCWLLILANPQAYFYANGTGYDFSEDNFKTLLADKTLTEACSLLHTQPLGETLTEIPFVGENIPMSYLHEVSAINEDTKIANADSPLELTRAVAKIILKNEVATNLFSLHGITSVVNVSRQAQLHNLDASAPVTLGQTKYEKYEPPVPLTPPVYLVTPEAVGQTTEADPIYVYETGAGAGAYMIIYAQYGVYNYFYKVPLADANGNPLDIKRNHSYTFTIKRVNKPGYSSIASAMAEIPSNSGVDATLTVTNLDGNEVIANNEYYLALSNSRVIAYANYGTDQVFNVCTIITNCTYPNMGGRLTPSGELEMDSSTTIPTAGSNGDPVPLPVRVKLRDPSNYYMIGVQLGDLYNEVRIFREDPIGSAGTGNDPIKFYNEEDNFNHYLLGADVSDPSTTNWIKLTTTTNADREISSSIMVDDGRIHIHVAPNTSTSDRWGYVEMSATKNPGWDPGPGIPSIYKIRVAIMQKGTP